MDFQEWRNTVWKLFGSTQELIHNLEPLLIALMVMATIIIILAIAILWNQRKIKKQLRQLLEQKEQETADKPQE